MVIRDLIDSRLPFGLSRWLSERLVAPLGGGWVTLLLLHPAICYGRGWISHGCTQSSSRMGAGTLQLSPGELVWSGPLSPCQLMGSDHFRDDERAARAPEDLHDRFLDKTCRVT